MIAINELIQQAFTRTGLVGEGQAANGTKATSALNELNDLIQVLNQQEYISDNLKCFDVRGNSTITIGDSPDFDIQIKSVPSHIKSVARKIGDRFVGLISTGLETINAQGKNHLATMFTYNVDFDLKARTNRHAKPTAFVVKKREDLPECKKQYVDEKYHWYATETNSWGFAMGVGTPAGAVYTWATYSGEPTEEQLDGSIFDYDYGTMKGTITLDANHSNTYKVMFIDEIPEYNLGDKLYLQDVYKSLLLAGLTYKLAIRYKLQEWISVYKNDFDEQKSLIKRINQTNRNMTWGNMAGSYIDNYVNGFAGGDW